MVLRLFLIYQENKDMAEENITGWKTKYGAIVVALGMSLLGASEVAPNIELGTWMKFIGTVLTGFGSGLTAVGLGHKIEKGQL